MKIRRFEAWYCWKSRARFKFCECAVSECEPYKSVQTFFNEDGSIIATHPQTCLTVEDTMQVMLESDYEVIVKEAELDDGQLVWQHWLSYAESLNKRRTVRNGKDD